MTSEWLLKLKGAECQGKGGIMKRIVKWLIAKYLPGYHLAKNPPKGKKKPPVSYPGAGERGKS